MLNNVVPTVQLSEAETRANSIRVQIAMVRSAKEKAKEKREVLDAKLHENTEYHKLALEIESLTSKKTSLKKTLFAGPEIQVMVSEIKDLSKMTKDCQLTLSAYLEDYEKKTGYDSFDGKKIIKNCRLTDAK